MEKQIKAIIFAETQAEFYSGKDSKARKNWLNDVKRIRQEIGEYSPWWKLKAQLKSNYER